MVSFQYRGTDVVPHTGSIPAATINCAVGSENAMPTLCDRQRERDAHERYPAAAATGLHVTSATAAFATGNDTMIVTVFYSIIRLRYPSL